VVRAANASDRPELLAKIMSEVLETERAYVADLKALIALEAVWRPKHNWQLPVVEPLLRVHMALLDRLQDAGHCIGTLGLAFGELAPFLRIYADYCTSYTALLSRSSEWRTTAARETALKSISMLGQTAESLLIKPVQRLCKYPLFFSQLLGSLDPNSPERNQLQHTMTLVQQVAADVNDKVSRAEASAQVVLLHAQLGRKPRDLVVAGRSVVLELEAWTSPSKSVASSLRLVLLSDVLIVAAARWPAARGAATHRVKASAPLSRCRLLRPSPALAPMRSVDTDGSPEACSLEICLRGETFALHLLTAEAPRRFASAFLAACRTLVAKQKTIESDLTAAKPVCKYGVSCYRTHNPQHLLQFAHPHMEPPRSARACMRCSSSEPSEGYVSAPERLSSELSDSAYETCTSTSSEDDGHAASKSSSPVAHAPLVSCDSSFGREHVGPISRVPPCTDFMAA